MDFSSLSFSFALSISFRWRWKKWAWAKLSPDSSAKSATFLFVEWMSSGQFVRLYRHLSVFFPVLSLFTHYYNNIRYEKLIIIVGIDWINHAIDTAHGVYSIQSMDRHALIEVYAWFLHDSFFNFHSICKTCVSCVCVCDHLVWPRKEKNYYNNSIRGVKKMCGFGLRKPSICAIKTVHFNRLTSNVIPYAKHIKPSHDNSNGITSDRSIENYSRRTFRVSWSP